MTLLGSFNIGASPAEPSTMNMSLDEMIAARRKNAAPNNFAREQAEGNRKAKREASLNARRGITASSKPTIAKIDEKADMEIEKTIAKKEKQLKKTRNKMTAKEKSEAQREIDQVKSKKKRKKALKPPSAEAIEAAIEAMRLKGFRIPPSMQMVMSFVPKEENNNNNNNKGTPEKPAAAKNNNNNKESSNNKKGNNNNNSGKNNNNNSNNNNNAKTNTPSPAKKGKGKKK